MKNKRLSSPGRVCFFTLLLFCSGVLPGSAQIGPLAGPIVNAANGHKYFLLGPASWTNAEAAAVALGGHLVTVNNDLENAWVYDTFANYGAVSRDLWIGLYDTNSSTGFFDVARQWSRFAWVSGQPTAAAPELWGSHGLWFALGSTDWGYFKMCGPATPIGFDAGRWVDEPPSAALNSVVELPLDLEIIAQPQGIPIGIGDTASLAVFADGTSAISFQWVRDGTNLPGATTAMLTFTNAQPAAAGFYSAIVSNASGSLTSSPALVSVVGLVAWGQPGSRDVVPPQLTNVLAIAAGAYFDVALKSDGTVVAWGDNSSSQLDVPLNLSNVTAVAAGSYHSLALRGDGTVVSWGSEFPTNVPVPLDLTNAVAIDVGVENNLALRSDGTVVAWGFSSGSSVVPADLSNVVAVSAGSGYDLALKSDGTVVEWNDATGQIMPPLVKLTNIVAISAAWGNLALRADGTVVGWSRWFSDPAALLAIPSDLTNVVAVSAKGNHGLAVAANGVVVAWGTNFAGESTVPLNLPNVVAIAGGQDHSIALLRDGSPRVTVQPWDLAVASGGRSSFVAKAVGMQAMGFQWRFNGLDIPGATKDTYSIPITRPVNAGAYKVSISNELGVVISRQAKLVVSGPGGLDTNLPPMLAALNDRVVNELSDVVVVNTGTDPTGRGNAMSYRLLTAPVGATIDTDGLIRWTPTDAQAPSTNLITTVVSYDSAPTLSATNSFVIIVRQVGAPMLPAQFPRNLSALSQLVVTNTAVNPDISAGNIGYELLGAPAGAAIDQRGVIHWTPARAQGPSTNLITTVATVNGAPRLDAINQFVVVVSAPTLVVPADYVVNAGQTVTFRNSAVDNDPLRTLSFSLDSAPQGGALDSHTGIFTWRPPASAAGTTNRILLRVTDDSVPPVSDVQPFTVVISPLLPVFLTPGFLTNGEFQIRFSGTVGPDYILQASAGRGWINLQTSSPAVMPSDFVDRMTRSSTNQLYRVLIGP
jgi:Regulator of Chromosome Condensation (RCC1) repeat protein/putative Ig domain-containing protein